MHGRHFGDLGKQDLSERKIPSSCQIETYVLVGRRKIYKTFGLRYIYKPRRKFVRGGKMHDRVPACTRECGEIYEIATSQRELTLRNFPSPRLLQSSDLDWVRKIDVLTSAKVD
jgi:hypothetical protein